MILWMVVGSLTLTCVMAEEGWSEPFIVNQEDLGKQPIGSQLLAVSEPVTQLWLPGKEGAPFPGSNWECQDRAFTEKAHAWTWQPNDIATVQIYNDEEFRTAKGVCRLIFPSETVQDIIYLYSRGQAWAFDLFYLNPNEPHQCPWNNSRFEGVEKRMNAGNLPTYHVPAPPNKAEFCIVRGQANPSCMGIPVILEKNAKISIWNGTIVDKDPLFISGMYGGCGARLPLYELQKRRSAEYSTDYQSEDNGWVRIGWVWSKDHC